MENTKLPLIQVFNLSLRFLLELAAWIGPGYWAWHYFDGLLALLLALALPLGMMSLWTIFAVANDPSRSGKTVVPTSGKLRILLELAEFGLGTWAWFAAGHSFFAYLLIGLLILHHLGQLSRLKWLWNLP